MVASLWTDPTPSSRAPDIAALALERVPTPPGEGAHALHGLLKLLSSAEFQKAQGAAIHKLPEIRKQVRAPFDESFGLRCPSPPQLAEHPKVRQWEYAPVTQLHKRLGQKRESRRIWQAAEGAARGSYAEQVLNSSTIRHKVKDRATDWYKMPGSEQPPPPPPTKQHDSVKHSSSPPPKNFHLHVSAMQERWAGLDLGLRPHGLADHATAGYGDAAEPHKHILSPIGQKKQKRLFKSQSDSSLRDQKQKRISSGASSSTGIRNNLLDESSVTNLSTIAGPPP